MKLKSERLLNDFISMKASVYPLYNIIWKCILTVSSTLVTIILQT
jgi:hypothetical protein